jgi:hypothetical protein
MCVPDVVNPVKSFEGRAFAGCVMWISALSDTCRRRAAGAALTNSGIARPAFARARFADEFWCERSGSRT